MAAVKSAYELRRNGGRLRLILYDDGVINCCSLDGDKEKCCFTSSPGEESAYWSFLDYLKGRNYEAIPIEGEVKAPEKPCTVCSALKSLKEFLDQQKEVRHD